MRQLLLAFLMCTSLVGFGQCPPGSNPITLNSQAGVNNFGATYSNCSILYRTLIISGTDITDLSPLSGFDIIGSLRIVNNPNLTSLDGLNLNQTPEFLDIIDNVVLNNIASLLSITISIPRNQLVIQNNPMLISLNGLQSFRNGFGGPCVIDNNDSLTNLIGLNNVIYFNEFYIENNDGLVNFEGLSSYQGVAEYFVVRNNASLTSFLGIINSAGFYADDFTIENNPLLTDISSIDNFVLNCPADVCSEEPVISDISIRNNPNLAICNYSSICDAIGIWNPSLQPNNLTIENNAEGCNSIAQVASQCGLVPNNDDCNGALSLTIGETLQAYNQLATTSTETPSCNDSDRADVWFTFNSGINATVDILVDAGYNIQLWEGSCGALTQVAGSCSEGSLSDFSVTTNTDYYVQVWSCESCRLATGLFTIQVQDGTLSTTGVSIDNDIRLFPNPVKNSLTINAKNNIAQITVFSIYGQQILESKPNTLETTVDFEALKSGIYLVKVESDGKEQTFKVVKQ